MHFGEIGALTASQDGALLVSGSTDQTIRVWQTEGLQLLRTLRPAGNEPVNRLMAFNMLFQQW